MVEQRKCAVCPADISDRRPSAKTCSENCKQKMHRQNKTARLKGIDTVADAAVAQTVQATVKEYINREVLTENLLGRIKEMVGLAPDAIATLKRLLDSEDDEMAVRAATTILRYTMGNPSVAPAPTQQAPSPVTIQFGVPRPGDDIGDIEGTATETRMCNDCHNPKPVDEFVASSNRCKACFRDIQEGVQRKLAPADSRDHTA